MCVCMLNDINSNIYDYNEVLSSIHMLQSLYNPNFIICGGKWNTDFTRKTSLFTKSLVCSCDKHIELRVLLKVSRIMKISLLIFSSYFEELYNSVSFDSVEWSDIYKTLNNKICNECINHIVNFNDVEN